MTITYHYIETVTDWLVRFNIYAVISLAIIAALALYGILSGYNFKTLYVSNYGFFVFAFIDLIIALVVPVLAFVWYYRATRNIHSFGAKEVYSPRMAVFWWFIPIFCLWKPYRLAQQIWKASNPQVKLINGTEWKYSPSSKLIKINWVLFLLDLLVLFFAYDWSYGLYVLGFLANFVLLLFALPPYFSPELMEQWVRMPITFLGLLGLVVSSIIGIVLTITFIKIIRQISTWQELKHTNL